MKERINVISLVIIILLLSVLCLLGMHLSVSGRAARSMDEIKMLSGCILDVVIVFAFFTLLLYRWRKASLIISFGVILFIALSNIVYARFFNNYLTLDCFSVVGEFGVGFYLQYLTTAFRIQDCLFLLAMFLVWKAVACCKNITLNNLSLAIVGFLLCGGMFSALSSTIKDARLSLLSGMDELPRELTLHPKDAIRCNGVFITQMVSFVANSRPLDLSEAEASYIYSTFFEQNQSDIVEDACIKRNVVFILVESLLSCAIDLEIDRQAVMPFLKSLQQQEDVYFNRQVSSNVSIGESSDGQFIYLTGLMPLPDIYTVNVVKNQQLPSLPRLLKEKLGYSTMMTIPTAPDCWHQDRMCLAYGIDSLYSSYDYEPGNTRVNDSIVFEIAKRHQERAENTFFDMVLTVSMHSPYDTDGIFKTIDYPLFSQEYLNYLSLCKYTDRQIEGYLNWTKQVGLYDQTVFIIAADHPAHDYYLKETSVNLANNSIPLYIIGAGAHPTSSLPDTCNIEQIDLYPSLCHCLGIKPVWKGVGFNIFVENYQFERDLNSLQEQSSKIIKSGIFTRYR